MVCGNKPFTMHGPGDSRGDPAVVQCMIQVVVGRSRCTMHDPVVVGKKLLYNA